MNVDHAARAMRAATIVVAQCVHKVTQQQLVILHGAAVDETALFAGYRGRIGHTSDASIDDATLDRIREETRAAVKEAAPIRRTSLPYKELVERFKAQKSIHSLSWIDLQHLAAYEVFEYRGWVSLALSHEVSETAAIDGLGEQIEITRVDDKAGVWIRLASLTPRMKVPAFEAAFNAVVHESSVRSFGDVARIAVSPSGSGAWLTTEEAHFNNRILHCAQTIHRLGHTKLILISGPSASGKTTFSHKLASALRALGRVPTVLSTDDYYMDATDPTYPRTPDGKLNHEVVEAMRLEDFGRDINALFAGETVNTPIFDMKNSRPKAEGRLLTLPSNGVLIMEGIFALDPKMTAAIPQDAVFRIFIVPIPVANLDDLTFMSNQNVRQLRRIARDYRHRGRDASASIARLSTVRAGEEISILPNMIHADYVFNSAMLHELPVLHVHCQALLKQVTPSDPSYATAQRLLGDFLTVGVSDSTIPGESLLREFIGGSVFDEDDTPAVPRVGPLSPSVNSSTATVPVPQFDDVERTSAHRDTLAFLLCVAAYKIGARLVVRHDCGLDFDLVLYAEQVNVAGNVVPLSAATCDAIQEQLDALFSKQNEIQRRSIGWLEAEKTFETQGSILAANLLKTVVTPQVPVVALDGFTALAYPSDATLVGHATITKIDGYAGALFSLENVSESSLSAFRMVEACRAEAVHAHSMTSISCVNDVVLRGDFADQQRIGATLRAVQATQIARTIARAAVPRPRVVFLVGRNARTVGAEIVAELVTLDVPCARIDTTAYAPSKASPQSIDIAALRTDVVAVASATSGAPVATRAGNIALESNGVLVVVGVTKNALETIVASGAVASSACFTVVAKALPLTSLCETQVLPGVEVERIRRLIDDVRSRGATPVDALAAAILAQSEDEEPIAGANAVINTLTMGDLHAAAGAAAKFLKTIRPDAPLFSEAQRLLEHLAWIVPAAE